MKKVFLFVFAVLSLRNSFAQKESNDITKFSWFSQHIYPVDDFYSIDSLLLVRNKFQRWGRFFYIVYYPIKGGRMAHMATDERSSGLNDYSKSTQEKWRIYEKGNSFFLKRKVVKTRKIYRYKVFPDYDDSGKINTLLLLLQKG